MLPFSIALRPGEPIAGQVIFAVTRAMVRGQLRAGDAFPSVRALSQALKINPNTAHRIVAGLVDRGLLTVLPGIGTVVAQSRPQADSKRRVLDQHVERLVVEAKAAGLRLDAVQSAVRRHWTLMTDDAGPSQGEDQ